LPINCFNFINLKDEARSKADIS